jgi:DNA helicase-2/ATP-dependent DNA helicase PcrA
LKAINELQENPGQWAVFNSDGNCAVLAGPGSGKTKCLTTKIARVLAEDVSPPQSVACITYSNECVRELQRRLNALGLRNDDLYVGTVHAFCFQHVIQPFAELAGVPISYPIKVASETEQDTHFARVAKALRGGGAAQAFRLAVDRYRRTVLDRGGEVWRNYDPDLAELADAYERSLRKAGLVDFEDMVVISQQLIRDHDWVRWTLAARFPVIAVDEYQDLGPAFHRIVTDLADKGFVRVIAVGDPDQSIYRFMGSQPKLLETLADRNDFERIVLPFNYRSAQWLVQGAEAALGLSRGYEARSTDAGTLEFHKCPEGIEEQAQRICEEIIPATLGRDAKRQLGDIAVLYPDKNLGSVIAYAADEAGLPYQRIDKGAPYRKTPFTRWVERCAAWCAGGWRTSDPRLSELINDWKRFGPNGLSELQRQVRTAGLVTFLSRYTDADPLLFDWLQDFHDSCLKDGLDTSGLRVDELKAFEELLTAAKPNNPFHGMRLSRFAGNRGSPEHLNLITLFSAKGLEFDVVIIIGLDEGILPSWADKDEEEIAEARRKFYVAFTRAKREVHLTYSGFTVDRYGRRHNKGPSRFLFDLAKRLRKE